MGEVDLSFCDFVLMLLRVQGRAFGKKRKKYILIVKQFFCKYFKVC